MDCKWKDKTRERKEITLEGEHEGLSWRMNQAAGI